MSQLPDDLGSPLSLAPILETPGAVLNARAIAEVPRVVRRVLELGAASKAARPVPRNAPAGTEQRTPQ